MYLTIRELIMCLMSLKSRTETTLFFRKQSLEAETHSPHAKEECEKLQERLDRIDTILEKATSVKLKNRDKQIQLSKF